MSHSLDGIVLRNACALLETRSNWTSGAWARDCRGQRCSPLSREAHQWCAWGALQKCAYDLIGDGGAARTIADRISHQLVPSPGGLAFVNERGGYKIVRNVMHLGGPPMGAQGTWPFPDYRQSGGFAKLAHLG